MEETDLPLASGLTAKVGIVEDEILIADGIRTILLSMGYTVPEPSADYDSAMAMLRDEQPDLVLLDINLAGSEQDGIAVARYIRNTLHLPYIFLTANSDPGTISRAKEVAPNAFLVKPFLPENLHASIEIAMHNFYGAVQSAPVLRSKEYILIKEGSVQHKVSMSEILYLASNHVYVGVFTAKRKYLVRSSLQQYLEELDPQIFIRVHRGYAVNRHKVEKMTSSHIYVGEVALPISKRYREAVVARL